jgi:hypothetical protein
MDSSRVLSALKKTLEGKLVLDENVKHERI